MDYTMAVLIIITVIHINIAMALYIKKSVMKSIKKIIRKISKEIEE